MKPAKIYLTTDTHFEHKGIEEYCGRPSDYNELLLADMAKLRECDLLIHLGDFAFARLPYWVETYLKNSPCKKWIILGNHDKKPPMWWVGKGFDFAGNYVELEYQGKRVALSHQPVENPKVPTIHGHWHNVTWRRDEFDQSKYKGNTLIAVENNDYKVWDLGLLLKDL